MRQVVTRCGALVLLAGAVFALSVCAGGFALAIAPLIVLLAFLVCDRYPGEQMLERFRARRAATARCLSPARSIAARGTTPVPPRSGITIAFALAVRPPPACC